MSRSALLSRRQSYREAAADFRDPGQLQAYESRGNCVVLAGPGSGKTKTLTVKLARMLAEDVRPPQGIACITYSLECAGELQNRLAALGVEERRNIFIGTVHSFCFKNIVLPYGHLSDLGLLPNPAVATDSQRDAALAEALGKTISSDEQPARWSVRFQCYRRTYPDLESREFLETDPELAALVLHYEAALRAKNLIDFDSMVLDGLRLIERHEWVRRLMHARFPILAVDEYQDLGLPLHRIVMSLCFDAGIRLLAVGDPDQSIYGAFGSRPELLQALADREGMEAVRLPFNYRCGQTIVTMSETVLGHERGYRSKAKRAGTIDFYECPEGLAQQAERVCHDIVPAAVARRAGRKLGDIAVLYLDKNDGEVIVERRKRRVELVRFLFAHRDANLSLCNWLSDLESTSLRAVLVRVPTLADERIALAELKAACASEGKLSELTIGAFSGQTGSPDHLNLITLHSAKGLEFDVVVMLGMDQDRIPSWAATSPESKQEQRRLFYVGLTRARHEVHMTYSGWTENRWGRRFHKGASEFLLEVQRKLVERG